MYLNKRSSLFDERALRLSRRIGGGWVSLRRNCLSSKSHYEIFNVARKLHYQFGHASASKLQKLVKACSVNGDELLELIAKIENCCEI